MTNKASWDFEWSNLNRRRMLGSRVKIIYKINNSTSTTWGYLLSNWKAMLGLKMIKVLELHRLLSWLWVSQMFHINELFTISVVSISQHVYHVTPLLLPWMASHYSQKEIQNLHLAYQPLGFSSSSRPSYTSQNIPFTEAMLCFSEIQFPPQDPCTWWSRGLDHFPLSPHYCLI